MKRAFFLCILVMSLFLPGLSRAQGVVCLEVEGAITPVVSDYIMRGIRHAESTNASALVIRLNTPGGLLKSTRVIVSAMMSSRVPVVVYVGPGGAQAGSAGVFITMAAHVAAMAPGTNIGAAHPVTPGRAMDSVMNDKVTNDAVAFIRSIAHERGRDSVWAEDAVRNSVSITAGEALEKNVINFVSSDMNSLLRDIDGSKVRIQEGEVVLKTAGAAPSYVQLNFIERLLNLLADPNIAYILMLMGMYGLIFELYSPGAILPGVLGGICLILALYSMHTLPINYAGLALIVFGLILFILEIKVTSYGLLGIGGTIALLLGSLMLLRNESPLEFFRISRTVIATAVLATAGFFFFVVGLGARAQNRKVVTGREALLGATALALDSFEEKGPVQVMGEIWQAESLSGRVEKGQTLKVTGRENLVLKVEIS